MEQKRYLQSEFFILIAMKHILPKVAATLYIKYKNYVMNIKINRGRQYGNNMHTFSNNLKIAKFVARSIMKYIELMIVLFPFNRLPHITLHQ